MAKSTKASDGEFNSRRSRGIRTEKPPPGFNRFGSPIHCGIRDVPGGAECSGKAEYQGMCNYHADQRQNQQNQERREAENRGDGK